MADLCPRILAIDPGPEQSGWCALVGDAVRGSGVLPNREMLAFVGREGRRNICDLPVLAVEMFASYGMPVGREVFDACVWIGRFVEAWAAPDDLVQLVERKAVKLHLCGTSTAKDPNVRQALLDLFPATGGGKTPQVGTKAKPGPLYGVSSHAWSALAVAVTVRDRMRQQQGARTEKSLGADLLTGLGDGVARGAQA